MKKYNLSNIMKRAWEIKRQDKRNIFAVCLHMAWEEAKGETTMSTISVEDYLLLKGGKLWTSYGQRRVYVNADNENFGGEKFFYDVQKDNFSNAEIGEKIREEAGKSGFDTVDALRVNLERLNEEFEKIYNEILEKKEKKTIRMRNLASNEAAEEIVKKFDGRTVAIDVYMQLHGWASKDGGMEYTKEFDKVMKLERGETRGTKLLTCISNKKVEFTVVA